MPIENVSDTARWVAVYRAMETERRDAIFRDPFARKLAGQRGEEIVNEVPRGREMAWAMIVRTALIDELVLDAVRGKGVDVVVNLAAGLDARPWRLDVPPTLRWVDVDLPGILDFKQEQIGGETPRCRYEAVKLDLRDVDRRRALFTQINASATRVLVISEGLLIYLEPDQVAGLSRDLAAQPNFRYWVSDIASPLLMRFMKHVTGFLAKAGSPFKFFPAEGTAFFAHAGGWRELQFRSTGEEGVRLKRTMRGMWLFKWIGRLYPKQRQQLMRRASGVILLEH